MKIKEMPWYQQPWTRVELDGVSAMNDAELLAAVLGQGYGEENAVDLSNRVLESYTFSKLAVLSLQDLKREFKKDILAIRIAAMFEIVRRTNKLTKFTKKIRTAEDVYEYYIFELKDKIKKYFYALYLDKNHRIIYEMLLSIGTLDVNLIHPWKILYPAIKTHSHSIILVHNNPSGECKPSLNDIQVMKLLFDAGKMTGINVIDYIIIWKNGFISLNEKRDLI